MPPPPCLVEWFSSIFNAFGKGQRRREKERQGERERARGKKRQKNTKDEQEWKEGAVTAARFVRTPALPLSGSPEGERGLILFSAGNRKGFIVPFLTSPVKIRTTRPVCVRTHRVRVCAREGQSSIWDPPCFQSTADRWT